MPIVFDSESRTLTQIFSSAPIAFLTAPIGLLEMKKGRQINNWLFIFWVCCNYKLYWLDLGSYYDGMGSSGECGVLAETMFYIPAKNRAKDWYRLKIKECSTSV